MIERRFNTTKVRALNPIENSSSPGRIEGYAATFNRLSSDMGGWKERIHPSAFTRSLKSGGDVVCTVNHSPSAVLGRLKNKSLQLSTDAKGLRVACDLPNTSTGRDIWNLVSRGDMADMSFAFSLDDNGDDWGDELDEETGQRCTVRTLRSVKLHDCAVVTSPAYPGTSINVTRDEADMVHVLGRGIPESVPMEYRAKIESRLSNADRRRAMTNLILSL